MQEQAQINTEENWQKIPKNLLVKAIVESSKQTQQEIAANLDLHI
jgi:hypothetical protein